VNPSKLRIVPNVIDTEIPPSGNCEDMRQGLGIGIRSCVLFAGSLTSKKGVRYLVEEAKKVTKENRETLFVIIRSGPQRKKMLSDIEAANFTRNLTFIAGVSEQDLSAVYRFGVVFKSPYIQEWRGTVLLEAQSSAKSVVAFDLGGVRESIINGETGLLVKPSGGELSEAILSLLSDAS
jgi:glycosyltransferase involved in cell wall biosynthesis